MVEGALNPLKYLILSLSCVQRHELWLHVQTGLADKKANVFNCEELLWEIKLQGLW